MKLLGGEVAFKVMDARMDGFEVVLRDELILVLANWKGLGGAGALRDPIESKSSFPVILTPRTILATWETLRHMLDFRSSMSCFGFG